MDMHNHKVPKHTSWSYDYEKKGCVLEAMEDISEGSEVCCFYGEKCNTVLLCTYGFTIKDNPYDVVRIFDSFDGGIEKAVELSGEYDKFQLKHYI